MPQENAFILFSSYDRFLAEVAALVPLSGWFCVVWITLGTERGKLTEDGGVEGTRGELNRAPTTERVCR